jgi:hypothetical protein
MWQVFYCLRAGALREAAAVLKHCSDEGVANIDEAALSALEQLVCLEESINSTQKSSGSSGWRGHSISAVRAAMDKCRALYQAATSSQHSTSNSSLVFGPGPDESLPLDQEAQDPYRLQVR